MNTFKHFLSSGYSRILFVFMLYVVYGAIAFVSYAYYNDYLGKGDMGLNDHFFLANVWGLVAVNYLFIFRSSYNVISIMMFLLWTKYIRPIRFICFLGISIPGLVISYLAGFLIFPKIEVWKEMFLLHNVPRAFGDTFDGNFIGNIVIGSVLFYSWFIPLWYYKLGDWFWRRGRYAKD